MNFVLNCVKEYVTCKFHAYFCDSGNGDEKYIHSRFLRTMILRRSCDPIDDIKMDAYEDKQMVKYVFLAFIDQAEDRYNVTFPDTEDCYTCGKSLDKAIGAGCVSAYTLRDGRQWKNDSICTHLFYRRVKSFHMLWQTQRLIEKYCNKLIKLHTKLFLETICDCLLYMILLYQNRAQSVW